MGFFEGGCTSLRLSETIHAFHGPATLSLRPSKTVCAFQRRLVKAKRRLIAPSSTGYKPVCNGLTSHACFALAKIDSFGYGQAIKKIVLPHKRRSASVRLTCTMPLRMLDKN